MDNKQIRLTFEDVKLKQQQLDRKLEQLIIEPYFEDYEDWESFPKLVADATLSASQTMAIKTKAGPLLTYNNGLRRVMLGYDVCDLTRKLTNMIPGDDACVKINDRGVIFTIKSTELWKFFRGEVHKLYGIALSEAIHMSKEIEKRRGSSLGFDTSNVDGEL